MENRKILVCGVAVLVPNIFLPMRRLPSFSAPFIIIIF